MPHNFAFKCQRRSNNQLGSSRSSPTACARVTFFKIPLADSHLERQTSARSSTHRQHVLKKKRQFWRRPLPFYHFNFCGCEAAQCIRCLNNSVLLNYHYQTAASFYTQTPLLQHLTHTHTCALSLSPSVSFCATLV